MKIPFTAEEFQKRLAEAPPEVPELIFSLEQSKTVQEIAKQYFLSDETIGDMSHEITKTILGFSPSEELVVTIKETLDIPLTEAQGIYRKIEKDIFSVSPKYIQTQQTKLDIKRDEKKQLEMLTRKNAFSSHDVLNEIENPSLSIQPTSNSSVPNGSSSSQSLGGFASQSPAANPASNIAAQLDQKLSAPAATAPREIYQVKKPDPYHEPIE